MHSTLVTISIALLMFLECVGIGLLGIPFTTLAIVVAAAVALIGIPHGGLDHRVGSSLLGGPRIPGLLAFFAVYLLVAAGIVAGWYVSPLLTIIVFFSLSAWHFGLEEDERKHRSLLQWAGLVARGGMVIWVPALFQGPEVASLLNMVLPYSDMIVANQVVGILQVVSPILLILTITDSWVYDFNAPADSDGKTGFPETQVALRPIWQHRMRVVAFFALFAIAHPLVSFGIYFCGWHSIRGLIHLHQEFGGTLVGFGLQLLPISIVAVLLFAGGFYFWSTVDQVTPAIVRTIFIGLSAVAVPHLLLHVVSDTRESRATYSQAQRLRRMKPGVAL